MEAKELMIGNYVQYDNLKKPIRVSIIDTTETSSKTKAKPIPLTEEWLINFGFRKKEIDKGNKIETGYEKHSIIMLRFQDTDSWYACPKGYPFVSPELTFYVHQFQNFVFAFTGIELTIQNKT